MNEDDVAVVLSRSENEDILTDSQQLDLNDFIEVSEPLPWGGEAGASLIIVRFKSTRLDEMFSIAPMQALAHYYSSCTSAIQQRASRYWILVDVSLIRLSQGSFTSLAWKVLAQIALREKPYPATLYRLDFVNCQPSFPFLWRSHCVFLAEDGARKKVRLFTPSDESWRTEITTGVGAIDSTLLPPTYAQQVAVVPVHEPWPHAVSRALRRLFGWLF